MSNVSGKSILFFSPQFFNYEKEIKIALEKLGANVIWLDDRPSNSFITKVLIRLNKNFVKNTTEKYYDRILNSIKSKHFDYILFISPESLTKTCLRKIKDQFNSSKFILYMWDSFDNKQSVELLDQFDSVLTFDSKDAATYNLKLRPLFYIDIYKEKKDIKIIYDLLFIGTAHSDRYKFIEKYIKSAFAGMNIKLYFFLSSKKLFWLKKLFNRDFSTIKYNEVFFKSLSHQDNSNFMNKSKIILDINHPKQVGLTMRTIEALGVQRKLITTNKNVVEYDFYNENNILVIDRESPKIDKTFINKPFDKADYTILNKYSINGWIDEVFC
ncbi:MAG: hypothetical protein V4560_10130 [Bacteroidota bacterium]